MAKKLAPFSALQKAKDYIDRMLSGKVDKVSGKGLSTNDYTTTEKNKLSGIASGAEVNVQSDWNQSTTTADDYIKNKPTKVSDFTNDEGYVTGISLGNTLLSYMPKISNYNSGYIKKVYANGNYLYFKVCTITISNSYVNRPIVMEISGRDYDYSTLQIMFANNSSTDPDLSRFITNSNNNFWIRKADTSVWEVYGKYAESWGDAALFRITGGYDYISVDVNMENISELPSGITRATYWGNVETAEVLRIVNQDSAPITSEIILNNINTYSQKGITYHGVNIANYNIMPNVPANGFILTIPWAYDGRSGTYFRQFFVDDDANTPICVRYYSSISGTFGAWKALAYIDDIPSTYAGSSTAGGIANSAYAVFNQDTRNDNSPPSHYTSNAARTVIYEFKTRSVINAPGTSMFGNLITLTSWYDNSAGYPVQIYISSDGTRAMRNGVSDNDWSPWIKLIDESNIDSYLPDARGTQTVTGNPITVTDAEPMNAESVKVELEPKQDSHGYDKPWAGGAGKNKLNYDSWKTVVIHDGTAVWENNGVTLTSNGDDCYTSYGGYFPNNAKIYINEGETIILSWEENTNTPGRVFIFPNNSTTGMVVAYNTVSKSLGYTAPAGINHITFRFGVDNNGDTIAYKNIMIRKSTESADFEPYSNICPISGYSEVNVERVGKNLADPSNLEVFNQGRYVRTIPQGMVYKVEPNTTYTLTSKYFSGTDRGIYGYDIHGNMTTLSSDSTSGGRVFTTNSDTVGISFYFNLSKGVSSIDDAEVQLELGSIATAYEPYQGTTYTVSLGGTKYGGVLDVTEGDYSDEWGFATLDGTETWVLDGHGLRFNLDGFSNARNTYDSLDNLKCSGFPTRTPDGTWSGVYGISVDHNGTISISVWNTSDVSEFTTWLSNNPIQIAYRKKTPSSVSTTPTDIPLLENTNNISSDGTNIQLKYQPNNVIGECKAYTDDKVDTKVDKVNGKGLSTNDYTTAEKDKLAGIASGAEVNVQPDWNQSNTTADDYIKNKPSSMPASDVYPWAKAATKPSYSASEVGLGNVGNFKAVSTVANQGLSDTEKTNARDNIGAASNALATTTVKGLMAPDDKNTLNVLNARHKIRVISAQNSYNSSTGISTVTFTLNPPSDLDGWGKFYRVSSMDSTGFGCLFTLHCFAGGLNIANDKLTPNCTMTTSGSPVTGLTVTLVSTEGVGYSGQFRVKVETVNY